MAETALFFGRRLGGPIFTASDARGSVRGFLTQSRGGRGVADESAGRDFQARFVDLEIEEPRPVVDRFALERLAHLGGVGRRLADHEQEAAAAGAGDAHAVNVGAHAREQRFNGLVRHRAAQPLLQFPRHVDVVPEGRRVLAGHGVCQVVRHHVLLLERRHNRAVAVEVTAHDLLEDVLCQPRHAGVIEQGRAAVAAGVEHVAGHVVDARVRDHAGARAGDLRAAHAAADLVLPAAAGGERLLEAQHVVEQRALVGRGARHAADHRQDHRAQDAGGAEAAALRYADERGQLDAAAELFEHAAERHAGGPVRHFGREAGDGQRGLGQREAVFRAAVVEEFLEVADFEVDADVDRAEPDDGLLHNAAVALDGRLAVEVDGDVEHVAAVLER